MDSTVKSVETDSRGRVFIEIQTGMRTRGFVFAAPPMEMPDDERSEYPERCKREALGLAEAEIAADLLVHPE